uniref:Carboxylesterase type B domain-containing protein n=1 Tax=Plectus sambesii TaxID=2011161 RepID=A0A914VY88_9BILA
MPPAPCWPWARPPAPHLRLLLLNILHLFFHVSANTPHVRKAHPIELTIDSGSIRGEYLTIGPNEFAVFKGIPYAAPPVGSLRFQPPELPAKWRGVMNATQYPPMCAQKPRDQETDPGTLFRIHRSEDCLYLNVFAPPPFTNDTYPVVVWIHGGNFQAGSSADFPQEPILKHFVARKVVFVSINYRLGPLGFLSTGDSVLPGNNGLWDQILALKWVQQNAHAFGGDNERVLLFGQGSGAASASILALSPRAEGLFQRVMLMSGTAISPGIVRDTAINATWALDKKLHCRSFNSTELLDCFRKRNRDEILDFPRTFYDDYHEFVPIIDGYGGVIPEAPEMLASYRRKVPMMIGTTRDESALSLIILNRQYVNMSAMSRKDAERLVVNLTSSYAGFVNHPLITEGCKYQYIYTKTDPGMDTDVLKDSILDLYSHFWYDAPASRLATYYKKNKANVFLYSFDHVSENFEYEYAFHGSDAIFLFETEPKFLETRRDRNWQTDRRVTETFADLIVHFARTGTPTPEDSGFAFNWTVYDDEQLNYLSITDSPRMEVGFRWQGHVFWNWYARHLDAVDIGNLHRIAQLKKELGDYQLATWILLFCALFFFAILVGLACYCTRKDADEDDM